MKLKQIILCSAFLVPLNKKDNWQELKFSSINPHTISFSKEGMKVGVNSSAMPLIFPLKKTFNLKKIKISGKVIGELKLTKSLKQGAKGNDDYVFKLGLVIPGEKTLPFYKRAFAPSWIKKLFDLAPKDGGVDRIEFYNAYHDSKLKDFSRVHPLGDGLITEKNVWQVKSDGSLNMEYEFKKPVKAAAIWISIDGDDTKSSYEVVLSKIELIE